MFLAGDHISTMSHSQPRSRTNPSRTRIGAHHVDCVIFAHNQTRMLGPHISYLESTDVQQQHAGAGYTTPIAKSRARVYCRDQYIHYLFGSTCVWMQIHILESIDARTHHI
jgi:hypothetical protein